MMEEHDDAQTDFLNPAEARVLGCLLEKEVTTPEYYPLSLNALTNACNQKSNRNPSMLLEETMVREAADALRTKSLVMMFHGAESRVPKFKHTIDSVFQLNSGERAILCELLLRGAQTAGELRTRCERLHPFADIATVEDALQSLATFPGRPLVSKLPRQTGQKEQRWRHLLSGPSEPDSAPAPTGSMEERLPPPPSRLQQLEEEVARLRSEVTELRDVFAEFRKQFD